MNAIDGIVYCPLYEEVRELQAVFGYAADLTEALGLMAFTFECGGHTLLAVSPDEMGTSTAHATIRRLKDKYSPRYVVCIGICGSIHDDARLGDVCFSQEIIDIIENQKHEDQGIRYQPKIYNSIRSFDKRMGIVKAHVIYNRFYEDWRESAQSHATDVFNDLSLECPGSDVLRPNALRGPVACGPISASDKLKKRILGINRKTLAIETESSGIYQAIDPADQIEVIAIRGVSDLADNSKKLTEVANKSAYRKIAAHNAASFLRMQLEHNPFFSEELAKSAQGSLDLYEKPDDPIRRYIEAVGVRIEESLTELSPDYRAQGKGYRLPVPRVREIAGDADTPLLEPIDLISTSTAAIVEMPSTYPDKGLPWLYAKSLLGQIFDGKIVVPITIDGRDIKPPKGSLASVTESLDLDGILTNDSLFPVIILTNFPFSSQSRVAYLLKELSGYGTIIMANGPYQSLLAAKDDLSGWKKYALCEVSFRSIVDFLSANFQLDMRDAEIIALRLSNTFRSFNVSVHPSYFAGIPKELLTRFSEVNHRAEIIDLAVTGFLSFFGAGETKEVHLKQRTRRLFLRELAYRDLILKERMDMASLISFVEEYARKHDFGIESLEFIDSFVKNGILHVEGERITFAIPFIQNYLLAERLSAEPELAHKYFDPILNEIDFNTFELYAEIGLLRHVLNDIRERIRDHIRQFEGKIGVSAYTSFTNGAGTGTYKSSGHILVDGSIKPRFLKGYQKLSGHQKRIESLANELLAKTNETEAKQEIIDFTDRAREEAKAQRVAEENEGKANSAESEIGRDWTMGVLMLGSAAEELDAETKRGLAADIVRLGCLIIDDWTASRTNVDFSKIKDELLNEVESRDPIEDGKARDRKRRDFVEIVVDLVELRELSAPFMSILHVLSESARNKVLYQSVNALDPDDSIQELVYSLWKLELRDNEGLKALKATLKNLPKDAFLRVLIAHYLIGRAYWFRSDTARCNYVDGANEALKPLKLSLDSDTLKTEEIEYKRE